MSPTGPEVLDKVRSAYKTFVERDWYLLKVDANERSLTHKLAEYLQIEFAGWDVDCEYNRWAENPGEDPQKRLQGLEEKVSTADTKGKTVYPDIIVHCRGTTENLVVIEAKKRGGDTQSDDVKLHLYKSEIGYKYAISIVFPTSEGYLDARPEHDVKLFGSAR